jgi:uncharacterized protein YoxC
MGNPETLETLDTQVTGIKNKAKNATQKSKKMSNTDPTGKPGFNPCAHAGKPVPAFHKTPVS